jgi:hypothetical protein
MIRLFSLCRIYLVTASLYYLWYLALFFLTPNFPEQINLIAFWSVYWFLAVILFFYFKYIYLISYRQFALACGWSFVNILIMNWLVEYIYFYFFYISLVLMPFSMFEVFRFSEKMKTNVTGINSNGVEYEIDIETHNAILEELKRNEDLKIAPGEND